MRKAWVMEKDQSMKLVFYPWPGLIPLEQERDPCSVQRKFWECPFGAGRDHNLNSVLLGRDLSTVSSEMAWRFLCCWDHQPLSLSDG